MGKATTLPNLLGESEVHSETPQGLLGLSAAGPPGSLMTTEPAVAAPECGEGRVGMVSGGEVVLHLAE